MSHRGNVPGGIATYVFLAYAGSYAIAFAIWRAGGLESGLVLPLGLGSMFVPTLAAIVTRLVRREGFGDIAWRRFPLRDALMALFGIPSFTLLVVGLYCIVVEGGIHPASWLIPDANGMLHPTPGAHFGSDPIPADKLSTKIAVNLVLNTTIMFVFAWGEEFGWRGFLQPRLVEWLGPVKGIIVLCFVWDLWHLGFHLQGINVDPAHPIVGALVLAPLGHFGMGIFYGWLYMRSRSVWVVALAHAATNHLSGFPFRFVQDFEDDFLSLAVYSASLFLLGLALLPLVRREARRIGPPSSS